jgi:capsular exopolysaccharide synthesis family protein
VGPGFEIPVDQLPELDGDVPLYTSSWSDALDGLRGGVGIIREQLTNLIRLRFTASDSEFAALVVNGVAESYRDRAEATMRQSATRRREFLARQLATAADSVREAQVAMAEFQEEEQILDPGSRGTGLTQELRAEELAVRQLRYQESLLESLVSSLDDRGSSEGVERIITLSAEMVPGAETAYQRLRELQDDRSRLTADRFGYREGSSRVAVVDSLIVSARAELRGLAGESLDLTGTQLSAAERRVSQLRGEVDELPAQATAINQLEQRTQSVLRNFDLLNERYYEAQIAEAVATADVEIVDFARPPAQPDGRSTVIPIVLAGLLGLGTGLFGAIAREGLDKTIRRSGDAESATGLPILGMIPVVKQRNGKKGSPPPLIVREGHHGGPEAEAFKALPAMLRYAQAEKTTVVAVASQGPKEGKSFTAANLALALAKAGTRTLLIDCDLHRPRIASMFEVAREPGLAEFLTRQAPYEQCLRELTGDDLWVMPAGGRVPDPARLIGSPKFRALLEQAQATFDAVILDTPPVLAVSEVLDIASVVDGVVLVARADQTNRLALGEAVSRLRKVGAPLLGLILNGVESGSGTAGYGGYYYRYYSYDYKPDDAGQKRKRAKA